MTYQEILQAIGNLPTEQQDSLIELIRQQQVEPKQNGSSDLTTHFGDSDTNSKRNQDRSIYHAIERTPAQTAEGLQKIEKFFQKKRNLWNSMTEEERQISISQFAMLDEYLKESRSWGYILFSPIANEVLNIASELWARSSVNSQSNKDIKNIDVDLIISAQYQLLVEENPGQRVVVATTNIKDLSVYCEAANWQDIRL
jgi:hypothetical protein